MIEPTADCPLCGHEWKRHDPEDGMCDAGMPQALGHKDFGPCPCGRDLVYVQQRIATLSSVALASPYHMTATNSQVNTLTDALLAWRRFATHLEEREHEIPLWAALLNERAVKLTNAALALHDSKRRER